MDDMRLMHGQFQDIKKPRQVPGLERSTRVLGSAWCRFSGCACHLDGAVTMDTRKTPFGFNHYRDYRRVFKG